MNKDDIINMQAGPKMNQLIWWKVFAMNPAPKNNDMKHLPDYSGNVLSAWLVVSKIHQIIFDKYSNYKTDTNYLTLSCLGYSSDYAASFDCIDIDEWYEKENIINLKYSATGKTPALAICRAALLVVLEKDATK